jgi:hypothetical protein
MVHSLRGRQADRNVLEPCSVVCRNPVLNFGNLLEQGKFCLHSKTIFNVLHKEIETQISFTLVRSESGLFYLIFCHQLMFILMHKYH